MIYFEFFELTEREIDLNHLTGASRSPNPGRDAGKSEIYDFSDQKFSNFYLVKQKTPGVTSTMNNELIT